MSPEKEFLSIEEVADLLGVNYQLIYKHVRNGEISASRIGKFNRVSRKNINDYMERTKVTMQGGICSSCGNIYNSRLSLAHQCEACGEALCVDCWTRQGIRFCRKHQGQKNGVGSSGNKKK